MNYAKEYESNSKLLQEFMNRNFIKNQNPKFRIILETLVETRKTDVDSNLKKAAFKEMQEKGLITKEGNLTMEGTKMYIHLYGEVEMYLNIKNYTKYKK